MDIGSWEKFSSSEFQRKLWSCMRHYRESRTLYNVAFHFLSLIYLMMKVRYIPDNVESGTKIIPSENRNLGMMMRGNTDTLLAFHSFVKFM